MAHTAPLFPDLVTDAPSTEGIKYAGSKLKLIPYILQLARRVNPRTVLDGFAGTTRVSQALAKVGYRVLCNDNAVWSQVFGTCYLLAKKRREEFAELIEHLNSAEPKNGWLTEHYGGDPNTTSHLKKPWQIHNTRKADAIREEIERLALDPVSKTVALTSLILALDRIDSTLGHFASYLRVWSPRSYNHIKLKVPQIVTDSAEEHEVSKSDIFDLVDRVTVDLAYYDPPYGSNNEKMPPSRVRYAAYYHVWTSVCLFDRAPLFGKARRRTDSADQVAGSPFEEFRRGEDGEFIAVKAIRRLLAKSHARHVILSYSSGGRATARELHDAIRATGKLIETVEVNHQKNVMAGMKWTNEWLRDAEGQHREFLFLIERT